MQRKTDPLIKKSKLMATAIIIIGIVAILFVQIMTLGAQADLNKKIAEQRENTNTYFEYWQEKVDVAFDIVEEIMPKIYDEEVRERLEDLMELFTITDPNQKKQS